MSHKILVILLCLPSLVYCVRPYSIKFTSYFHEYRPEFYEVLSLRLYNDSQRLVLNGSAILKRDMKTFHAAVRMMATEKISGQNWKVMDVTVNGCDMLQGIRKKNIIGMVLGNVKGFGNIIADRCPYKKGVDYNVKDFYLNPDNFPPNAPNVRLNVSLAVITEKLTSYKGYFEVVVESTKPKRRGN